MAKVFFNWRGPSGRETVDELDSSEFSTRAEFVKERNRLVSEYTLAGMAVYTSSRACNGWQ